MSEPVAPTIRTPGSARIAYIGGTAAISSFLWIAALGVAGIVDSGDVPIAIFLLLLAGSVTTTQVAVLLGISYLSQQASATNQRTVLEAIGQLAREQEQINARVSKLDPWSIYSAAASDLLGHEKRN